MKSLSLTFCWLALVIAILAEQVENSSLYYEPASRTWWLFTNHVGLRLWR